MAIDKQNNRHTISPQTRIVFIIQKPMVLLVTTKVEQGKIRVGKKQLLVITGALIATTITQRAMSFHYW